MQGEGFPVCIWDDSRILGLRNYVNQFSQNLFLPHLFVCLIDSMLLENFD